ncbi:uncharacterized protein BXZ73DRAFT_99104 [Epithele typhae]|uniref:uncharacterized protein n=1 Tax=Epithele typhae TaxID=378194 RepID=UPI0020077D10|nr:uncharacterized protein BXZ73DRAFT_99104 [Epithele typhae]KAH9940106.1 hypothetical protein BXZ73DRAFT_99104 [Epithele typhae]
MGRETSLVRVLNFCGTNPERAKPDPTPIELRCISGAPPPPLRALLNDAIPINSTAFEDTDATTGVSMFVGSKTETALLAMARDLGWPSYKAVQEAAETAGVPVLEQAHGYGCHVLVAACAHQVVSTEGEDAITEDTEEVDRARILESITLHASQTLRTIAVCYQDFDTWLPKADEVSWTDLARDLTPISFFALEDPLLKMCTGDVLTMRSIATHRATMQRLQVLARSSLEDKHILVNILKELGEIIAEASEIVLVDDGFASIVKVIIWGCAVENTVRKFLRFQVTLAFAAVVVSALAGTNFEERVDALLGFPPRDLRSVTLVFNAFVIVQVFSSFNCPRLDRRHNIFEGVLRNPWFISITFIDIVVQIPNIFGSDVFTVTRLAACKWGVVSIPIGVPIRAIPNAPCECAFKARASSVDDPPAYFARGQLTGRLGAFRALRVGAACVGLVELSLREAAEWERFFGLVFHVRAAHGRLRRDDVGHARP